VEKISKNKIKFLRALRLKKNRDKERMFLVEGEKMVKEAIQFSSQNVQEVYVVKNLEMSWLKGFDKLYEITSTESEQISGLKTPNKCMALLKFPEIEAKNKDFTLVLDQVQDPGNLGTIIRLADWFGIDDIVCSKETADCFNPKVIQATMGSIYRTQIKYEDLREFLSTDSRPKYGAFMEGHNVYDQKLNKKAILVMGNEGNGISEEIQELVTDKITIPRLGQAESLNVASATGILLSEFFRA
jgi:RNA methyltransferase, TrmH family